ncbi:MAG TPA: hypothetical protein VIY90_04460 [Steroidobacteraceae bacterium]
MRCIVVLWLIAVFGTSFAQAAQNAPQRVRAFAALPDWTGLWDTEASRAVNRLNGKPDGNDEFKDINKFVQLLGLAPYTEAWGKKLHAELSNPAAAIARREPRLTARGFSGSPGARLLACDSLGAEFHVPGEQGLEHLKGSGLR